MWKLSKTAYKAVTIVSLLTEVLMNPLSDMRQSTDKKGVHNQCAR